MKQINDPRLRQDIVNELKILAILHQKGHLWGIKEKASKAVQMINSQQMNQNGYLSVKYLKDLSVYIRAIYNHHSVENNLRDRLPEIHQLLAGLKHMHDNGIVHGDIKPNNILVKKDREGQIEVHLADFGGARQITQNMSLEDIGSLRAIENLNYTPIQDVENSWKFFIENKKQKFIEQKQKQDVFAIGCVIYQLLTGKFPYPLKNDRPDLTSIVDIFSRFKIFTFELTIFLAGMLAPNSLHRPSATESFSSFDTYLRDEYLAVYQSIQQRIEKGNYQLI